MSLTDVDYTETATPIGTLVLAARDEALKGSWFVGQKHFPEISAAAGWRHAEVSLLSAARRQLDAWFAGTRQAFDLPLAPEGTPFQCAVWAELARVPWGQTVSYAELAARIGQPRAFHPVGAAIGRNPLMLIVPCHRALGSDGSLTGYAGGLGRKRWLLDREGPEQRLFPPMDFRTRLQPKTAEPRSPRRNVTCPAA